MGIWYELLLLNGVQSIEIRDEMQIKLGKKGNELLSTSVVLE